MNAFLAPDNNPHKPIAHYRSDGTFLPINGALSSSSTLNDPALLAVFMKGKNVDIPTQQMQILTIRVAAGGGTVRKFVF